MTTSPDGIPYVLTHKNCYTDAMKALDNGTLILRGKLRTGRCRIRSTIPEQSYRQLSSMGYFPAGNPRITRPTEPSQDTSGKPPTWIFNLNEGADFQRFLALLGFGVRVEGRRKIERAILGHKTGARNGAIQLRLTGPRLDEPRRQRITCATMRIGSREIHFGSFAPSAL
jgi:hypothetical protein